MEEIGDLDEDRSKLFKEALASEGQQNLTGKQKIIVKKVTFLSEYDVILLLFGSSSFVNTGGFVYLRHN